MFFFRFCIARCRKRDFRSRRVVEDWKFCFRFFWMAEGLAGIKAQGNGEYVDVDGVPSSSAKE